jgi:hypothetical protein
MFMRLLGYLAAAAFALGIVGDSLASDVSPDLEVTLIVRGLNNDLSNCDAYRDRLDALITRPDLETASPLTRRVALSTFLQCSPKDSDATLAAARQLTSIAETPFEVYAAQRTLLRDARRRSDIQAYLQAFAAIVDADPSLVANWNPLAFDWALTEVRDDPAAKLALLSRLRDIPWAGEIGQDGARNGWAYQQAMLLADAGDVAKAAPLIEGSDATWVMMSAAQDKRFATLWPALQAAGRFDWTKVSEAELDRTRRRARANPGRLEAIVVESDLLRSLGRYDEAAALGADYAKRLQAGETFEDARQQRGWVLNAYAYVLSDLGRFDEADAVMASAEGADGVSQRINRAELLNDAGHPAQALSVIAQIDPKMSSPFGAMWRDAAAVCAHAQLGDAAATRDQLDLMRPRWRENAAALTKALICADALDEAAALYVRRLDTPATRFGALAAFRSGRAPPVTTPVRAAFEARRAQVLARPEVQAALAKWGRALTLPLAGTYWGDL